MADMIKGSYMHVPGSGKKYRIPKGLKGLLEEMSREVMRHQPDDIYKFLADYLEGKLKSNPNYMDGLDDVQILSKKMGLKNSASSVYLSENPSSSKQNQMPTAYVTPDGKEVFRTSSGRLLDADGKEIPPGTKLKTADGEEITVPASGKLDKFPTKYITPDGKGVYKTNSGRFLDANGKPIPPGTKLTTPDGKELTVPANGKDGAPTKYTTPDGKAVVRTSSGRLLDSDGKPIPPGTELTASDGSKLIVPASGKDAVPIKYTTPDGKGVFRTSSGRLLDENGKEIPPGTKLTAPDGSKMTVPENGKMETIPTKYTTPDGKGVFKTNSGRLLDADGKPIPPGTKLTAPDGSKLTVPANGKIDTIPTNYKTPDGKEVFKTSSGRLLDANGQPIPPGTKLTAPDGSKLTVPANGKIDTIPTNYTTPDGKEVFKTSSGRLLDANGQPIPPGTKLTAPDGSKLTVPANGKIDTVLTNYTTPDGKPVFKTNSGHLLDADGKPIPPGTKLTTPNGAGITVPANGKETTPTRYITQDGKEVVRTSSGRLLDSNGKPIPPGTKLASLDGSEFTVPASGKDTEPTKYKTPDGKEVFRTRSGRLLDSNGKQIPPGTKLTAPDGTETVVPADGKLGGVPTKYTTPDGKEVLRTSSGTLVDADGKPIPPGTKLRAPDGSELIVPANGKIDLPPQDKSTMSASWLQAVWCYLSGLLGRPCPSFMIPTTFTTPEGLEVLRTNSGRLIDANGLTIPPGRKLTAPDGTELTVPANGKVDAIPTEDTTTMLYEMSSYLRKSLGENPSLLSSTKYKTPDGKEVLRSQSGHFLDTNGKPIRPGTKLSASDGETIMIPPVRRADTTPSNLTTPDGRQVLKTNSGHLLDADGKVIPPGTKLTNPDGIQRPVPPNGKIDTVATKYITANGKEVFKTNSGTLLNSVGEPLPPGTKLIAPDGSKLTLPSNQKIDNAPTKYVTPDGKEVFKTPSGRLVDANDKQIPPGAKLSTDAGSKLALPSKIEEAPPSEGVGNPPAGEQRKSYTDDEMNQKATVIQAAYKGYKVRRNSKLEKARKSQDEPPPVPPRRRPSEPTSTEYKTPDGKEVFKTNSGRVLDANGKEIPPGTKLKAADGEEVTVPENGKLDKFPTKYTTPDGKDVYKTNSGRLLDANGKPIPPGSKLTTPNGKELTVPANGKDGAPTKYTTPNGKEVVRTSSGRLLDSDGQPIPPGTKLTTPDGKELTVPANGKDGAPTKYTTPDGKEVVKTSSGRLLDSDGQPIPPGTKLTTPDGKVQAVPANGKDEAPTKYTTPDGKEVVKTGSGRLLDSDGQPIPPGTKLTTADGKQLAVPANGKDVTPTKYTTPDGKEVIKTSSGRLLASDGQPIPPGTILTTPNGKELTVPANGKDATPTKYTTPDGKEVAVTSSGRLLDSNGKPIPPGTKLRSNDGDEIFVPADNKIDTIPTIFNTPDGKEVLRTGSGRLLDAHGQPIPPGTKIKAADGSEVTVSANGQFDTIPPSGGEQRKSYTDEEMNHQATVIQAAYKGYKVRKNSKSRRKTLEDAQNEPTAPPLPVESVTPPPPPPVESVTPPPIPPRVVPTPELTRLNRSGKMFSEDGQEIFASTSGRVMTLGGEKIDNETKIKTINLKEIISGDATMPESKVFTMDGKPVVFTSSGRVFTFDGKELKPGTLLKTKDSRIMMISPSGGVVYVDASEANKTASTGGPSAASGNASQSLNAHATGRSAAASAGGEIPEELNSSAGVINDILSQRRNTEEGMLSEEQSDPEAVMTEWSSTVDEFMTVQLNTVEKLLNGTMPMSEARGTIIFLTVSFVVGLIVGYGIVRSLGLVGGHSSSSASHLSPTSTSLSRQPLVRTQSHGRGMDRIGSLLGADGIPLSHSQGVDPGVGKCKR